MNIIMKAYLLIIGVFLILEGLVLILFTQQMKNWLTKLLGLRDFRPLGVTSLVFSILLFLASSYSKYTLLVVLIGLIGLFKGLFFMFTSYEKTKFFLNWWIALSEKNYRILGIIILIIGVLIAVSRI